MEHLPQHHPRGSSEQSHFPVLYSFCHLLCAQGPRAANSGYLHSLAMIFWGTALRCGCILLPPCSGVGRSQHRAREMRTCWGIMPIQCPLTSHKSFAPRPYLPLPRPRAPPPPPSPRLMVFLDVETSFVGTLGCAWEHFNGSICRKV